jgi:FkbM family methyltransferase
MLTTKTKVTLAGLAYRTIALGRAALGRTNQVTVRRGGFRWSLDLSEGIDFSIYLLGAFEKSTVATLRQLVKPGDVAFDIGANIGAHTLGLAQSVGVAGKVYAFEPSDFAFAKLQANLALNPELAARTHASQVLLAGSEAESRPNQIYASWPLESEPSVHPKHRGRLVTMTGAAVDTLDRFVERHRMDRLDVIKLDVDGHELPVLRGGFATLRRLQPTLLMEMSPYIHAEEHHSFSELITLLREAGYRIEDASSRKKLPLDAAELERLIPDGASINVVALPGTPRPRS